jgi:hypothetical protein
MDAGTPFTPTPPHPEETAHLPTSHLVVDVTRAPLVADTVLLTQTPLVADTPLSTEVNEAIETDAPRNPQVAYLQMVSTTLLGTNVTTRVPGPLALPPSETTLPTNSATNISAAMGSPTPTNAVPIDRSTRVHIFRFIFAPYDAYYHLPLDSPPIVHPPPFFHAVTNLFLVRVWFRDSTQMYNNPIHRRA